MNSTMVTGWATVYSTTSASPTTPIYYPTVILTQTTSAWPSLWQQVQLIHGTWSGNLTAVADPWQPAAPAVIRALERTAREVASELEQRLRQVREQRQAASARARELLIGELDPVQRAQFEAEGYFEHIGRRRVRYRIRPAVSGNIEVLRRGRLVERLCVHPIGAHRMPVEDTMLAQLLHLRDDEQNLLRIANHHPALAA